MKLKWMGVGKKVFMHRLTYSMLDAVPPIHAESSHVATDKVPSK